MTEVSQLLLTNGLVKSALENSSGNKNITVNNITFSKGCSGGDNYCSEIIRAKVDFSDGNGDYKECSLIIKCIQKSPQNDILVEMGVFDREKFMFLEFFPRMERILQKEFSPKFYLTSCEPVKTFIMDDLNFNGYKLGDRVCGLDLEHSKFVMENLGEFHAGSLVFIEKYPEIANQADSPPMFPKKAEDLNEVHSNMFGKTFETFISVVSENSKFEKISKKLRNMADSFLKTVVETYDNSEDKIKVINHGDCWVNNIMFKYTEGRPVGLKFIDFQFSYFASPGIDINYFLLISCQPEVLKTNRDELILTYYNSLVKTLHTLEFSKIPSLDDILQEIRRKEFYGFMAFTTLLPILSMESKTSADNCLENIGSDGKQNQIFHGRRFQEMFEFCLNRFDELGLFEDIKMIR